MPDQWMGYTTKAKTRKWTLVAMAYLLDVVRVNSQTLFELKKQGDRVDRNGEVKSFEFGWKLVESLVTPNMHAFLALFLSFHLFFPPSFSSFFILAY